MAKHSWIAAIIAALAIAIVTWPDGSSRESSGTVGKPDRYDSSAPRLRRGFDVPAARIPPAGDDRSRPSSLRGTEVDGSLPVDGEGHLIASPDVIRFFDYFFVTSGEVSDSAIESRIEKAIADQLEEPARAEAMQLLAKYLSYRSDAAELYADQEQGVSIAERIAAIGVLRIEVFGDDTEALFGSDIEYAGVAAEMQKVSVDDELSDEERAQRLAELDAQLPEEVRDARAAALGPLDLAREEAALRADGGGGEDIRALREERFGAEAADRLDALDLRRDQWRGRIDQFRRQRSEIESDSALSEDRRAARIDELLQSSFSASEQTRVGALDRIELGR